MKVAGEVIELIYSCCGRKYLFESFTQPFSNVILMSTKNFKELAELAAKLIDPLHTVDSPECEE